MVSVIKSSYNLNSMIASFFCPLLWTNGIERRWEKKAAQVRVGSTTFTSSSKFCFRFLFHLHSHSQHIQRHNDMITYNMKPNTKRCRLFLCISLLSIRDDRRRKKERKKTATISAWESWIVMMRSSSRYGFGERRKAAAEEEEEEIYTLKKNESGRSVVGLWSSFARSLSFSFASFYK